MADSTGPIGTSASAAGPSAPSASFSAAGTTGQSSARPGPEPLPPLTGFRAALEHTGLPRGVLTWKPRLPSRNWTIFLTLVGTVSYLYYDDRRQCRQLREDYIRRVEKFGKEPCEGSLDIPRKVKVYGARWPEDDDDDRSLRYFRKYVKPYLVAAAVDYEQVNAPLYGSVARQVHAEIVKRRRQALGLEQAPVPLSLPVALDPETVKRKELAGGIVLVGRPTLKEYLEGLKRGWSGGVDSWEWEKEVEKKLEHDGIFQEAPLADPAPMSADPPTPAPSAPAPQQSLTGGLGFLSRPQLPPPSLPTNPSLPPQIPAHLHVPPSVLPEQPPVLLVPFTNHTGFKQIPYMIYDFFTERFRVKSGGDAAMRLIFANARPFEGPEAAQELSTEDAQTVAVDGSAAPKQGGDLDFDYGVEKYYKKSWDELKTRNAKAREEYYPGLKDRLSLARSEREPTKEEAAAKSVSESELREERKKRELRWTGNEEGYEIVRKETPVAWDERWRGWLKVYDEPTESAAWGHQTSS